MANRRNDWLEQARHDLEQAEASREDRRHEWACFAAHQAAGSLGERGGVLDHFYIPTRNSDGPPDGAPFEHYGPLQSELALDHARAILDFARAQVA